MSKIYTPIEMLDKLVSFDTVSRNSNLPIIEFIKDYLQSYGVESHLVYNDDNTKAKTNKSAWISLNTECASAETSTLKKNQNQ